MDCCLQPVRPEASVGLMDSKDGLSGHLQQIAAVQIGSHRKTGPAGWGRERGCRGPGNRRSLHCSLDSSWDSSRRRWGRSGLGGACSLCL